MKADVYGEVSPWKKPLHKTRANLAKAYLKLFPNLQVITITGSVGKTTTQNAVYKVLSQKFRTVVGDENLDPTFRIPKTILKTKVWDKYLILEYGVEHPGEMDYYLSFAKPQIAIITKITPTHIKYFKNIEGVFAEKSKMIKDAPPSSYVFLNADDSGSQKLGRITKANIIWFGKKAKNGVKISHIVQNPNGTKFRLHYKGQKASASWRLVGEHNLTAVYIASTVGVLAGLTLKQIAKGLSQTRPAAHRLNVIAKGDLKIIDDTYNSSPEAAREAVNTLLEVAKGSKKIAILGEMKDLGDISDNEHKKLGEYMAKTPINSLITIGAQAKKISDSAAKAKFSGSSVNVKNVDGAIKTFNNLGFRKSTVLIKGSRHEHLERVVYKLLGKYKKVNCYNCGALK